MSIKELKNKITRSLEQMDADQLNSTFLLIKEVVAQQKRPLTQDDKTIIDKKIETGIKQLENNEGKNFGLLLNDLEARYGQKK